MKKYIFIALALTLALVGCRKSYKLANMFNEEIKQLPKESPSKEMKVDVLGIRAVDEQAALREGDSIAKELQLDSIHRTVLQEKHNVYRPQRKNSDWYNNRRNPNTESPNGKRSF